MTANMTQQRREFIKTALGVAAATYHTAFSAPSTNLGIPGPYPGKVVAMRHEGSTATSADQQPHEAREALPAH